MDMYVSKWAKRVFAFCCMMPNLLCRMLGPLVGGYLAVWGGFSAPFYAAAIVGVLMIPIPILMPDRKQTLSDPASILLLLP